MSKMECPPRPLRVLREKSSVAAASQWLGRVFPCQVARLGEKEQVEGSRQGSWWAPVRFGSFPTGSSGSVRSRERGRIRGEDAWEDEIAMGLVLRVLVNWKMLTYPVCHQKDPINCKMRL